MAKLDNILQGDVGNEITVVLIVDDPNTTINDATSFELKIKKPDGFVIIRTTGITKVDSKTVKYSTEPQRRTSLPPALSGKRCSCAPGSSAPLPG